MRAFLNLGENSDLQTLARSQPYLEKARSKSIPPPPLPPLSLSFLSPMDSTKPIQREDTSFFLSFFLLSQGSQNQSGQKKRKKKENYFVLFFLGSLFDAFLFFCRKKKLEMIPQFC